MSALSEPVPGWKHELHVTLTKYIAYGSGFVDGFKTDVGSVNWKRVGGFAAVAAGGVALTALALVQYYHPFPRGRQSRSKRSAPFAESDLIDPSVANQFYALSDVRFVRLSLGRVRYILRTPAEQRSPRTVVLVHGFSIPADIWKQQSDYLVARGYRVLSFDNYGRGWSDAPDVPYDEDLYVGQIAELLFALGIDTPIDLIGLSMGGAIVSAFTARYPEKVARLGLVCPAGLPIASWPGFARMVSLPIIGGDLFKSGVPTMHERGAAAQWEHKDSPAFRAWGLFMKHNASEHPGLVRALHRTVTTFPMTDQRHNYAVLAEIERMPKLIVWGDKDGLTPYANGAVLQSLLPGSQFVTVVGAKHNFMSERADTLAEILAMWLLDSDIVLPKRVQHSIGESFKEQEEDDAAPPAPAAAAASKKDL